MRAVTRLETYLIVGLFERLSHIYFTFWFRSFRYENGIREVQTTVVVSCQNNTVVTARCLMPWGERGSCLTSKRHKWDWNHWSWVKRVNSNVSAHFGQWRICGFCSTRRAHFMTACDNGIWWMRALKISGTWSHWRTVWLWCYSKYDTKIQWFTGKAEAIMESRRPNSQTLFRIQSAYLTSQ